MTDTQRLTEAIWALTNELRMQADQGPSQTGAAPFTSGDFVTVTNPRSEWEGMTGRVRTVSDAHALLDFPGLSSAWIDTNNLTKAEDK